MIFYLLFFALDRHTYVYVHYIFRVRCRSVTPQALVMRRVNGVQCGSQDYTKLQREEFNYGNFSFIVIVFDFLSFFQN